MVLDVCRGVGAGQLGDPEVTCIPFRAPGTQRVGGVLVGVSGVGKLESAAISLAVGWIVVVAVFRTCAAVCGRGLSPVFVRMIVQAGFSTNSPDPQVAAGDGNQLPPTTGGDTRIRTHALPEPE